MILTEISYTKLILTFVWFFLVVITMIGWFSTSIGTYFLFSKWDRFQLMKKRRLLCLPNGLDTASRDLTAQQGLHPVTLPAVWMHVLHFKGARFEQGPLRFIIGSSSSLYKDMHYLFQKQSISTVVTAQYMSFSQRVLSQRNMY